jgi:hypothetical protein
MSIDITRTYMTIRNANITTGENMRYGYEDRITLPSDGMLLRAGEAADLESPGELWACNLSGVAITILVDVGRG